MIESDDFSSYSYSHSHGTMSNSYMTSSRTMDGMVGTDNDKKKKSFDIDVKNNCQQQQVPQQLTRRDIRGRSLLHYFAFNGDIESAKKLFSYSFPVDLTDESLNTPLHLASQYGQQNIAILLLEQQALINRQNINGKTALHLAVEGDHLPIVQLLLEHGANPNIVDLQGASPLHYSVANGSIDISQSLLRHGSFVNIKDYSKETPLFWAIRESKSDQVELLIKNGANVNAKNDDGETALELAQEFDEDDITIILQKALNPSPFATSSIILPTKSQPVNFVLPKGLIQEEQPIIENRPQSL